MHFFGVCPPMIGLSSHFCKIQDKSITFYQQFGLVICGLDSVEARRWMNATLVSLYDKDRPESLIPLIDGGTEGFMGQARVILPKQTSCYECSLDLHSRTRAYPVCTIANTPRLPEHCIEWASVLEWPRVRAEKLDFDNVDHLTWLYKTALQRAAQFSIVGVTFALTQGVVKNIIPAIASTNAIIAGTLFRAAYHLFSRKSFTGLSISVCHFVRGPGRLRHCDIFQY